MLPGRQPGRHPQTCPLSPTTLYPPNHPPVLPPRLDARSVPQLPAGFFAYLQAAGLIAFLLPAGALLALAVGGHGSAGLVLLGGYLLAFVPQMLMEVKLFNRECSCSRSEAVCSGSEAVCCGCEAVCRPTALFASLQHANPHAAPGSPARTPHPVACPRQPTNPVSRCTAHGSCTARKDRHLLPLHSSRRQPAEPRHPLHVRALPHVAAGALPVGPGLRCPRCGRRTRLGGALHALPARLLDF